MLLIVFLQHGDRAVRTPFAPLVAPAPPLEASAPLPTAAAALAAAAAAAAASSADAAVTLAFPAAVCPERLVFVVHVPEPGAPEGQSGTWVRDHGSNFGMQVCNGQLCLGRMHARACMCVIIDQRIMD